MIPKFFILVCLLLMSGVVAAQDDDTTITVDNADQLAPVSAPVDLSSAGTVLAMVYHPSDPELYAGTADSSLFLINTSTYLNGGSLVLDGDVIALDIIDNGSQILATTGVGSLSIINSTNGTIDAVAESNFRQNFGRINPEGTQIISVTQNNLEVRPAQTETFPPEIGEPEVVRVYGGGFTDLEYSPDGSIIAAATANGAVQLWDAETRESLGEVAEGIETGAVLAFNPEGTRLAVSTPNATTIYDTNTLEGVNDFREGGAYSAYTAGGDLLVLAEGTTLTLVDVAFGTVVASYEVELDVEDAYSITSLATRTGEIAVGTDAGLVSFYGLGGEAVVEAQDDDADVDELVEDAQTAYGNADYDAAIEAATAAIELDPQNLNAYRIRADSYRRTDQNNEAADDYTMVIELAPQDDVAYFYRALSRYRGDFEDNEAILADLNRAEEIGFFDAAWLYNVRGLTHNRLGNYEMALADMDRAIELIPTYSSAVSNRAWILGESLDEWAASVPDRKTVLLELAPNSASSYNNLAWAYVQLGQYQEALDFVNIALDIEPDESNSIDTRGWAYLGLDEYDLAEEDFNRAIELENYYSYWGLGELYAELGEIDRAIENLELYIELEGDFVEQEAIDLLNELTE